MNLKIIKTKARSIFLKTSLPGCDFTMNQYVGCGHACLYCYSRFVCRWKPYGKWGTWVQVKVNAPELVRGRYVRGQVWMSSVSDPYQPIEKKLKLTRKVLENMDKSIDLAIQTKSDLILRDVDLFKKFKKIEVGLTINGFKREVKELFEPYSSSHEKRLNTLKILKENSIKTYGFISPIIPELVNVKRVIKESRGFVDYYWLEILNLKASGREFISILEGKFPSSYEIMKDKEKFYKFVRNMKKIVKKEKVKTLGLVIHYPKFKIIRV